MKHLVLGLSMLLFGAGLSLAPVASAGPYCDFFDIAGLCDVRDAVKACSDYPDACQQYFTPESTPAPTWPHEGQ
ncbi:hypothetical protein [Mycolicibacterium obuense]|uniref:hypothetical protein n=1 Tax=Mycolicibacterium obuense TaxID=1807 RepID=UPI0023F92B2F|nr:hypothetical protein [Mycolicibacterium obuense]